MSSHGTISNSSANLNPAVSDAKDEAPKYKDAGYEAAKASVPIFLDWLGKNPEAYSEDALCGKLELLFTDLINSLKQKKISKNQVDEFLRLFPHQYLWKTLSSAFKRNVQQNRQPSSAPDVKAETPKAPDTKAAERPDVQQNEPSAVSISPALDVKSETPKAPDTKSVSDAAIEEDPDVSLHKAIQSAIDNKFANALQYLKIFLNNYLPDYLKNHPINAISDIDTMLEDLTEFFDIVNQKYKSLETSSDTLDEKTNLKKLINEINDQVKFLSDKFLCDSLFAVCSDNLIAQAVIDGDLIALQQLHDQKKYFCFNEYRVDGDTYLHLAINQPNIKLEVVKFLLNTLKINIHAENFITYETALHLAIKRGNLSAVQCLVESGAKVMAFVPTSQPTVPKEPEYRSTLDYAAGNKEIWNYLNERAPTLVVCLDVSDKDLKHWEKSCISPLSATARDHRVRFIFSLVCDQRSLSNAIDIFKGINRQHVVFISDSSRAKKYETADYTCFSIPEKFNNETEKLNSIIACKATLRALIPEIDESCNKEVKEDDLTAAITYIKNRKFEHGKLFLQRFLQSCENNFENAKKLPSVVQNIISILIEKNYGHTLSAFLEMFSSRCLWDTLLLSCEQYNFHGSNGVSNTPQEVSEDSERQLIFLKLLIQQAETGKYNNFEENFSKFFYKIVSPVFRVTQDEMEEFHHTIMPNLKRFLEICKSNKPLEDAVLNAMELEMKFKRSSGDSPFLHKLSALLIYIHCSNENQKLKQQTLLVKGSASSISDASDAKSEAHLAPSLPKSAEPSTTSNLDSVVYSSPLDSSDALTTIVVGTNSTVQKKSMNSSSADEGITSSSSVNHSVNTNSTTIEEGNKLRL